MLHALLNTGIEFFRAVFDVNMFTAMTVLFLGGVAYALVRLMTESMFLGFVYAPVAMLFGMISNYIISKNFLVPLTDKDSDTVLAVGIGVLIGLVFMILLTRGKNALFERRDRISHAGANTLVSVRTN